MIKKIITLAFMLSVLYSASPLVLAHTTIKDRAQEGVDLYTADVIAHGCSGGTKEMLNVIGQSVVFPNGPNDIVTRSDTGGTLSLGSVIVGGKYSHGVINPVPIQNKNVFDTMVPIADQTQVVRALHYTDGDLPETPVLVNGIIPFKFSGVTFVPSSCATQLNVQIAIADWCTQGTGSRRANVWIGKATPMFPASGPAGEAIAANFWPVLIVNRNLTTNPLPPNCGKGYQVTVEPSADAIDEYLPLPGFNP
ncbi:hypothetical conserved protein [Candidatus Nitrosoglobus terrae]|uniref:Hypothetical conserved protein n=1 Tax=Candidatus Nitrosoglobus terrae TaxID=1630141 RepID=A0A1Q2SLZ9_9GAMM|nr:hypothetical protein [Candidatus Nitrosoglobus terrae]BAW80166.1 hypothetical conserved protein [Candidatus Nitrosoglobus terrae]